MGALPLSSSGGLVLPNGITEGVAVARRVDPGMETSLKSGLDASRTIPKSGCPNMSPSG